MIFWSSIAYMEALTVRICIELLLFIMKLELKRFAKKPTYTIGRLYIDGVQFCNTLEDTDRGLTQNMSLEEIKNKKIYGKTAIPTGTYEITLNVVSPKYSKSPFMQQYANGARVPRLLKVPGYEGVLIHTGNTAADSAGCILVGINDKVGKITQSKETFKKLYKKLLTAKDKIVININ